jgi:hypothetical protein
MAVETELDDFIQLWLLPLRRIKKIVEGLVKKTQMSRDWGGRLESEC